jgi:hypothetical protein
MADSMSREEAQRYAAALWFAVHEKDLRFETADEFADWWTASGSCSTGRSATVS